MTNEEIESAMQKIIHEAQMFQEAPSNDVALELDKDISILRFLIGEDNFIALHYFRRMHEDAIKWLDEHYWHKEKEEIQRARNG